MTHPEELLAEYVDGSLAPDERAVVDAHLGGCERCRDEVALATGARSALTGLPQVDLPEGFRPDRRAGRPGRERLRRVGVVTGAAAASIAAILAFALLGHGAGGNAPAPAAGQVHGPARAAYDRARIDALATSLAKRQDQVASLASPGASYGKVTESGGGGSAGGTTGGAASTASGRNAQSNTGIRAPTGPTPLSCARTAALLEASDRPIQPIIRASYEGTPAYISAFRVNGFVMVQAVAREGCTVLYSSSAKVG